MEVFLLKPNEQKTSTEIYRNMIKTLISDVKLWETLTYDSMMADPVHRRIVLAVKDYIRSYRTDFTQSIFVGVTKMIFNEAKYKLKLREEKAKLNNTK